MEHLERAGAMDEMMALRERLKAHPWMPFHDALDEIDLSFSVFAVNWRDLTRFMDWFEDLERLVDLWPIEKRLQLDECLRVLARLVHNFVASVKTLVDHQRRVLIASDTIATPSIKHIYDVLTEPFRTDGQLAFVQISAALCFIAPSRALE